MLSNTISGTSGANVPKRSPSATPSFHHPLLLQQHIRRTNNWDPQVHKQQHEDLTVARLSLINKLK
ncbi:heterokaryon incompatibility protein [Colletotrichum asianum]